MAWIWQIGARHVPISPVAPSMSCSITTSQKNLYHHPLNYREPPWPEKASTVQPAPRNEPEYSSIKLTIHVSTGTFFVTSERFLFFFRSYARNARVGAPRAALCMYVQTYDVWDGRVCRHPPTIKKPRWFFLVPWLAKLIASQAASQSYEILAHHANSSRYSAASILLCVYFRVKKHAYTDGRCRQGHPWVVLKGLMMLSNEDQMSSSALARLSPSFPCIICQPIAVSGLAQYSYWVLDSSSRCCSNPSDCEVSRCCGCCGTKPVGRATRRHRLVPVHRGPCPMPHACLGWCCRSLPPLMVVLDAGRQRTLNARTNCDRLNNSWQLLFKRRCVRTAIDIPGLIPVSLCLCRSNHPGLSKY